MKVDIKKEYTTREGFKVIGLRKVTHNSENKKVTFPIKGSIVKRELPLKLEYHIWKENGRSSIFTETENDLIEK